MRYLVSEKELIDLVKGELKVDDLTKPENIALLTWSGDDIKTFLENKGVELEIDESVVNDIAHKMGGCSCGDCVTFAFDDYVDDMFGDKK